MSVRVALLVLRPALVVRHTAPRARRAARAVPRAARAERATPAKVVNRTPQELAAIREVPAVRRAKRGLLAVAARVKADLLAVEVWPVKAEPLAAVMRAKEGSLTVAGRAKAELAVTRAKAVL